MTRAGFKTCLLATLSRKTRGKLLLDSGNQGFETSSRLPLFSGDVACIRDMDFEAPIRAAVRFCCIHYHELYDRAANDAPENLQAPHLRAVYRLLSAILSFSPSFDDQEQPFGPLMQFQGKRTLIPSDLVDSEIDCLRVIIESVKDSVLISRLGDVLWIARRDYQAARRAIAAYLEVAEKFDLAGEWSQAQEQFQRALSLGRSLGPKKELHANAVSRFCGVIDSALTQSCSQKTCNYLEQFAATCRDFVDETKTSHYEKEAVRASEVAFGEKSHELQRRLLTVAMQLQPSKETVEEKTKLKRRIAESLILQANELERANSGPTLFNAVALLKDGIQKLQEIGEDPSRLNALKLDLGRIQKASLATIPTMKIPLETFEIAEHARRHVRDEDLPTAIQKFALGLPTTDVQKVRESVESQAVKSPLAYIFGQQRLDDSGRVIQETPSNYELDAEEKQRWLYSRMFESAKLSWNLMAQEWMWPAAQEIFSDHHPRLRDLTFLVEANAFVPPGHEVIFLRGIHAGFTSDLLTACHLLVPQIENSLRYLLEQNGVDTSNLMSDGTQPMKLLGSILSLPQLKRILGDSLVFDLRLLLIEKSGFEFRNRLAHGFVSSYECNSVAAISVWWLVIRLCILCQMNVTQSGKDDVDGTK